MRSKKQLRIGNTMTNMYGTYTIIDYKNAKNITVQRDDGYIFTTQYDAFKRKRLKGDNIKNQYQLFDTYGICYAIGTNEEIIFDIEDYDIIHEHLWFVHTFKDGYKRAESTINGINTTMQYLITQQKDLDHINNNSLDNRKSNLRPYLDNDGYNNNGLNVPLRKDNTSGHKGVIFNKSCNKWRGQVIYKRKRYVKDFIQFEDACKWVDNKRKELHGEFANNG